MVSTRLLEPIGTPIEEIQDQPVRVRGRSRRRRAHGRINKAWIWGHRWASLVLGLVLLVELSTGAVLLYATTFDE